MQLFLKGIAIFSRRTPVNVMLNTKAKGEGKVNAEAMVKAKAEEKLKVIP